MLAWVSVRECPFPPQPCPAPQAPLGQPIMWDTPLLLPPSELFLGVPLALLFPDVQKEYYILVTQSWG